MKVTNEQAEKIKALCKSINNPNCYGCRYNDEKHEFCPSTWYAPQLAVELLEARERIKEMSQTLLTISQYPIASVCEDVRTLARNEWEKSKEPTE